MASVFLSYDREDADRGRRIARALEKAGHSVWWDRRIKSGAQYGREIDEALKRSDAVLVLWSEKSIDSPWVRDEAAAGRDAGKLVPARIDAVDPPLGFRQYQTTDLTRWRGRRAAEFDEMLEAIASLPQGSRAEKERPSPATQPISKKFGRLLTGAVGLLAIIAIGLLAWRMIGRSSSVPVVAVAATDSSAGSQALARDLLVKLGALDAARPGDIDLVTDNATGKKPDLAFQVGRTGREQGAEANLALTDARHGSLLWAKAFRDPHGSEADLRQQLAYAAALALRCALETKDPGAQRLTDQSRKTYLNACAAVADAHEESPTALVPALQKIVHQAPRFAGGWAKLLLAETAVATSLAPEAKGIRPALARHIAEARKLHPHLAEAYIAEWALTPSSQFVAQSRILDEGIRRNPDNSDLRFARHLFLESVGRLEDCLQDARRAMELDPLSPEKRSAVIFTLAVDLGRLDDALAALNEAQRLWPGATDLLGARYSLHLRAGDPREALRLLRAGLLQESATPWMRLQEALLEARIDPSPEKVKSAVETARAAYDRNPIAISGLLQTLAQFNRLEELWQILLNWRRMDIVNEVTGVLFRPAFSALHKNPRFMLVAKRLGVLDYWRATGEWPDFCSRADLPYDCEREAAKLAA